VASSVNGRVERRGPDVPPVASGKPAARITRTALMADPLEVALPSTHPAAMPDVVDLEALADGVVVRPLAPPSPSRQLFAATRTGADQHPAVKHVLASLVDIARAGSPTDRRP
jgi:hypothetical protein